MVVFDDGPLSSQLLNSSIGENNSRVSNNNWLSSSFELNLCSILKNSSRFSEEMVVFDDGPLSSQLLNSSIGENNSRVSNNNWLSSSLELNLCSILKNSSRFSEEMVVFDDGPLSSQLLNSSIGENNS